MNSRWCNNDVFFYNFYSTTDHIPTHIKESCNIKGNENMMNKKLKNQSNLYTAFSSFGNIKQLRVKLLALNPFEKLNKTFPVERERQRRGRHICMQIYFWSKCVDSERVFTRVHETDHPEKRIRVNAPSQSSLVMTG